MDCVDDCLMDIRNDLPRSNVIMFLGILIFMRHTYIVLGYTIYFILPIEYLKLVFFVLGIIVRPQTTRAVNINHLSQT